MGGPLGNTNATIRHGLRSRTQRHGLVHAKLGRRFASAYGHCNSLRREVEHLVRQTHGSISLLQQAKIQTIVRLEEGVRALELAIRENPKMGAEELRQQRHSIAQWTRERDKVLAALVGDTNPTGDPWRALDAEQATQTAPDGSGGDDRPRRDPEHSEASGDATASDEEGEQ